MGSRSGSPEELQPNESKPMSVSSDELNLIVYRYLAEAGFVHSAFTFAHESMLGRSTARNAEKQIPPGALISFLQKGLQYVAIEERLQREGQDGSTSGDTHMAEAGNGEMEFSLLSSQTLRVLRRKNPPIQLNVPPATAAAAIKARLEAEAKRKAEEKASAQSAPDAGMADRAPSPSPPIRTHRSLETDQSSLLNAKAALAAQAAAAQAAATMSQLHSGATTTNELAGAALAIQQQRAAHIAVLQHQQNPSTAPSQSIRQDDATSQQAAAAALTLVAGGNPLGNLGIGETSRQDNGLGAPLADSKSSAQNTNNREKNPPLGASAPSKLASLEKAVAMISQRDDKPSEPDPPAPMVVDSTSTPKPSQDVARTVPEPKPGKHELVNGRKTYLNGDTDYNPTNGNQRSYTQDKPLAPPMIEFGVPQQNEPPQETAPSIQSAVTDEEAIEKEDEATKARPSEIVELVQHASEVFMCAWNPVYTDMIATGSGDASARIWQMGGPTAKDGCGPVKLLPHGTDPNDKKNKDVTTLEWSSDGKLLATGSYDGVARVWSRNGALVHTLSRHRGPIFSLKWNPSGHYLLSGSYDQSAIVWDVAGSSGHVVQQFTDHEAPALDVDWKDETTFASCSTDKRVLICRVGVDQPLRVYAGHHDEVNAVKWDPSGVLLASCSDDYTAKVWDVTRDSSEPLHDFKSHKAEIYTVKWRPTGPGSMNPTKQKMLATASFDGSVRLWNVDNGSCIRVFSRHRDSVYSVSFSPSGDFLASGSLAGQLYIWNVMEGKHIKSYKGKGDIFEVAWDRLETRVAACFSSNVVAVIDFHRPDGK